MGGDSPNLADLVSLSDDVVYEIFHPKRCKEGSVNSRQIFL